MPEFILGAVLTCAANSPIDENRVSPIKLFSASMPQVCRCFVRPQKYLHYETFLMDRLTIPKHIFNEMLSHCRAGFPNEACGLLAGRGNEISEIYKMSNGENSPVSYFMDPAEQFKAMKDMREKKLDMEAIFHSHPSSPAFPSAKDTDLAFYEDAVYVIVSLAGNEPVVKGFRIREKEIQEIEIVVRKDG